MAYMIVTSGEKKGEFLPLGHGVRVIGRAENLPLQIVDELVSRKHLRIRYNEPGDKYEAEDLESRHGVFINRSRISQATSLSEGDEFLLGNTTLLFTMEDIKDRESALSHYKKVGERSRQTRIE